MTGLELLKEKLIEQGATKSQVNTKVVEMVLLVLANEPQLIEQYKNKLMYEDYAEKIENSKASLSNIKAEYDEIASEYNKLNNEYRLLIKQIQDNDNRFWEFINKCESPVVRDFAKLYELFHSDEKDLSKSIKKPERYGRVRK